MSHLTILPTVITDLELLEETLLAERYFVQRPGLIKAFGQDIYPAELVATDRSGLQMGWRWDADGSLALMLDLGQTRFRRTQNASKNHFAVLCPEVGPALFRWNHLWSIRFNDRPAGS